MWKDEYLQNLFQIDGKDILCGMDKSLSEINILYVDNKKRKEKKTIEHSWNVFAKEILWKTAQRNIFKAVILIPSYVNALMHQLS